MRAILRRLRLLAFARVPAGLRSDFRLDSARRNNFRFSLLPLFCVFVQACSLFIHLTAAENMPGGPPVATGLYATLAAVYIVASLLFVLLFLRARSYPSGVEYVQYSNRVLVAYMLLYTLAESAYTLAEIHLTGSVYRLLVVSVLLALVPVIGRANRCGCVLLYTGSTALGLAWMYGEGMAPVIPYLQLVAVVSVVALLLCFVVSAAQIHQYIARQELLTANRRLQDAIERDPLTGLANRRALNQYMGQIWNECLRNGCVIHALMIDIDWFKLYNDHYGHQKGDECLVQVAKFLRGHFGRSLDMVARYGGEEFFVLLPYTSEEGVRNLAEAARSGVERLNIPHELSEYGRVSISAGVAAMAPAKDEGFEALIRLADAALYAAKDNGRNRVYLIDELPEEDMIQPAF